MNTQTINTELVLALRKCLPALNRDWPRTRAFALRVLADADARQREEQRVKNIVEAEAKRDSFYRNQAPLDESTFMSLTSRTDAQALRAAHDAQRRGGTPAPFPWGAWRRQMVRSGFNDQQIEKAERKLRIDQSARTRSLKAFAREDAISAADAKMQAARAVRPVAWPNEGYLPAAPPAKGCTCDVCTQFRRKYDAVGR